MPTNHSPGRWTVGLDPKMNRRSYASLAQGARVPAATDPVRSQRRGDLMMRRKIPLSRPSVKSEAARKARVERD